MRIMQIGTSKTLVNGLWSLNSLAPASFSDVGKLCSHLQHFTGNPIFFKKQLLYGALLPQYTWNPM